MTGYGTIYQFEFDGTCNPFGTLLYKASHDQEEVAVIDIDTDKSDSYRTHWPFLRDRRIDSYSPIVKRYIDDEA